MQQLDITQEIARRQAEEGMGRALDRAEREIPEWGDLAYARVVGYAKEHLQFCGWMVVKAANADPNFPIAPNDKAWGSVIQRAAREKIIVRCGTAKDPHRHGNPIPLWESRIFEI